MSNRSTKPLSQQDPGETAQYAFNDVDATHTVNGFLVGLVGRQVALTISTTNVANDTENYAFSENFGALPLYTFQLVYTDGTRTTLSTATRTA
jgi:hypothetical protein